MKKGAWHQKNKKQFQMTKATLVRQMSVVERPEGKVQKDATKAVNDPATAIGKKASAQGKEISGDAQQKGEGADKMDTPNDGMSKVAKAFCW